MALGKKISAETDGSPLALTDQFRVARAGANYRGTLANIFTAFGTASGGQLPFPATQNASSNANTLDDYEEGDWTPSLGGTATYTSRFGKYTKIGRFFHLNGQIVVNAIGTGSTGSISGSPFTPSNNASGSVSYFQSIASNYTFVGIYLSTGNNLETSGIGAAGTGMTTPAVLFANGTNLQFSVHASV